MMMSTIDTDSISAISTSCTAPWTKTASSLVTRMFMPSGRFFWMLATAARTPAEMSSVFDSAWRMMPSPMPVLPSERSEDCAMSGPSVTVATSPSLFSSPIISASNASGVVTSAVARTMMFWSLVVSAPAGVSIAIDDSELRMSAMVRPRLASFAWSMSMRNIFSRSP